MAAKAGKPAEPRATPTGSGVVTRGLGHVARRGAELGLTTAKTGRIAGRVNPELVRLAKERTGAASDSELIELALTSLILEDGFADAFRAARNAVDGDIEVGL